MSSTDLLFLVASSSLDEKGRKMSYISLWKKHAILREGKRLKVYKDSLGFKTVGIGHKVLPEDKLKLGDTITEEQCDLFFDRDTAEAESAALKQAKEIGIKADWFIAALISVNFQLGAGWTKEFKATYPAIVRHDFDVAIENLRQSKWYRQTPVRVEDFIHALEKAKTFKERPLTETRSVRGAGIAGAGIVIAEAADKLEPLTSYSEYIQIAFVVLALCGVALAIYARIDDRKKGHR